MNKILQNDKQLLTERVKSTMSLVKLEASNKKETNAIKQLRAKYAEDFGLDSEPMMDTHLITSNKYFNGRNQ
jgi:predicted DNA-binding protein (UPF0278 family)